MDIPNFKLKRMKPKTFKTGRWILVILAIGTTIALVSWDFKQSGGPNPANPTDTIPGKIQEKKIRDLDDVLDELNRGDVQVNMEKVQKAITEAMKQVDIARIRMDVEKGIKEVDMEKIQKEIEQSIAKIDVAKMQKEIQQSLKEIDGEKIRMEVENAIKDIDFHKIQKEVQESMDKMKVELDKVKNIDMRKLDVDLKKAEAEMKKLGPQIEKEMANAKIEIEKANVEMKEYKEFVNGLENDGLLNKKEAYTIKHKEGELVVNGKKVSAEVYSKYRSFLEKHTKFKIVKNAGDFNIDRD